ncbi:hypothetical protein [Arthrobacter alpinus]|uniref:hypothetical protein n=1 Tax=Arthrobacter alpinus TaxID=656366 RepID=UPI000AAFC763|nr:hypothetical protein [Arthrobacter alpinus]
MGSLPLVDIHAAVTPNNGTSTSSTPNCSHGTTMGVPREKDNKTTTGTAPANNPITVPRNAVKNVCEPDRAFRSRISAPTLASVAWSLRPSARARPARYACGAEREECGTNDDHPQDAGDVGGRLVLHLVLLELSPGDK